ncbi:MAG: LysM peptidoglycan-binding domain-containing protein [Desulfosarcina sp.]|nr:LysM peptidoglycan-binding domain-containing protein [Desulfobacterales bacterium]
MKTSTPLRITFAAFIFFSLALSLSATVYAQGGIQEHIVETETGVYYIVQPGDTLWDLSQHFSDTPWLWPDLWNENRQISNPHLIYPGDRIKLYRRQDINRVQKIDKAPKPEGTQLRFDNINAVGFIRREGLAPCGIVIEPVGPKVLIGQYDQLYLAGIDHVFQVGDKYTIYRKLKQPVRDNETNADIGIQHLLLGICEITEIHPDTAIAKVVQSWRVIDRNNLLTPFLERSPIIEIRESVPGLEGKFISNEEHARLTGQFQTGFIDKGETDGVEIGQYYTLYIQNKDRVWTTTGINKKMGMPRQDIGSVLVVHTEENTATVLLTRSLKVIDPWTRIATPF